MFLLSGSPSSRGAKRQGFTLIELLIVIAIILILIAIALPNFLEAQLRARVTRVQGDFRSLATAIESYKSEYGKYPPASNPADPNGRERIQVVKRFAILTTPIAFMTSIPTDPFFDQDLPLSIVSDLWGAKVYNYFERETSKLSTPPWGPEPQVQHSWWFIHSLGPDLDYDALTVGAFYSIIPYAATNGTRSSGDIIRYGP
ncbi:MAG: prepilin-type N-terminal cleavage/methylation domain-containing protein [Candidatus Omnitrophica bacterium]|nr:prepilin-type N-terminal cleavage/methylation domain-containing protein [Candidatus Omnitrophota bacterium]MCA9426795.1 prepilin-type N-terminal cleavage/methylation domain-containing protein [Candidatus Omnitrophota bacterium]MCA9436737.1 prepilin-type N-terminal cleavage/methylation domain-containing protein [Candidatus Omnitrophota bacterium]MCA9439687.1 prepilin-type N-terminal cleavage/methylation domain-containing protein [Candidatus Omnitrophota bacterium]MCB9766789.1 prepilin-type N-